MTELLTPAEHDAIAMAGQLWNQLCAITENGPAREGDLRELCFHIHGIQRAVLKQAAARAYPDLYRLLGGDPVGSPRPKLAGGFLVSTPRDMPRGAMGVRLPESPPCTKTITCPASVHCLHCPLHTISQRPLDEESE